MRVPRGLCRRSRPRLACRSTGRRAARTPLVRRHDRVAERQPALVGQEDEPDAPDKTVVRLRVAVAGEASELGSLLAARIARDRELGAISQPNTAPVEPACELLTPARGQPD